MQEMLDRNPAVEQKEQITEFLIAYRNLPPQKKERVQKLKELLEGANDPAEQHEIAIAMAEIVLPKLLGINTPRGATADPEQGISEETKRQVQSYQRHMGDVIRKRREELRLTQAQLAERSGLPQSHISRLEVGKHAPTRATIERIARALEVEPSKLDLLYD